MMGSKFQKHEESVPMNRFQAESMRNRDHSTLINGVQNSCLHGSVLFHDEIKAQGAKAAGVDGANGQKN